MNVFTKAICTPTYDVEFKKILLTQHLKKGRRLPYTLYSIFGCQNRGEHKFLAKSFHIFFRISATNMKFTF